MKAFLLLAAIHLLIVNQSKKRNNKEKDPAPAPAAAPVVSGETREIPYLSIPGTQSRHAQYFLYPSGLFSTLTNTRVNAGSRF